LDDEPSEDPLHGRVSVAAEAQTASVSTERVLIVTTSFPRFPGDVGGHFVESQAQRLLAEGRRVEVVAPGLARHVERRGALTIRWVGGGRAFGAPGAASRLRSEPLGAGVDAIRTSFTIRHEVSRALRTSTPTEVVAHWLLPTVWPWLASVPVSTALDAYAHGGDVRALVALPETARHAIVATLLRRSRAIHFAAAHLRDALVASLERDLGASLVARSVLTLPEVGPLTRDPQVAASLRERLLATLGAEGGDFIAVSMGRLVRAKRFDLALDAMRSHRRALLLVIGDGPARGELERRARDLGVAALFLGALARGEALAHLAAADVLVHPSEEEGAPTVVREARALGVPVLGCDAGDLAAWAKEDDGIRCVRRDPAEIQRALESFRKRA
jgi:glycosyltransferase involved in cell wall biosynthesis